MRDAGASDVPDAPDRTELGEPETAVPSDTDDFLLKFEVSAVLDVVPAVPVWGTS